MLIFALVGETDYLLLRKDYETICRKPAVRRV